MKPQYQIHLAKKIDIKSILAIIEDARLLARQLNSKQWLMADGYPNYQTFKQDIDQKELYVATFANKVVGVIFISSRVEPTYFKIRGKWLTKNQPYGVIHRLAVKKEYYGLGVAVELMNFAEAILKANGLTSIRIDTAKENQPMQRLINKLGYQYCGLIKLNKYEGDDDLRLAFEKLI